MQRNTHSGKIIYYNENNNFPAIILEDPRKVGRKKCIPWYRRTKT